MLVDTKSRQVPILDIVSE